MNALFLIGLVLGALLGWLCPWQGRRVKNPRRVGHADSEYTVAWISNEPHAFTDEQLEVARGRARRLKLE